MGREPEQGLEPRSQRRDLVGRRVIKLRGVLKGKETGEDKEDPRRRSPERRDPGGPKSTGPTS